MSVKYRRKALALASATAISTLGFLIGSAPNAQACTLIGGQCRDPMPENANCHFIGVQQIVADDGLANSPSERDLVLPTSTTIVAGDAAFNDPRLGISKGTAGGSIAGTKIQFLVTWKSGPLNGQSSRFDGTVFTDDSAGGTSDPNVGLVWYTKFSDRIKCSMPAGAGQDTAPAAPTATVKIDSNVFDAPSGNRIEAPFFLATGTQLKTVQPCADSWCLLAIPNLPGGQHGNLPPGQGWVYQGGGDDKVFLDVK